MRRNLLRNMALQQYRNNRVFHEFHSEKRRAFGFPVRIVYPSDQQNSGFQLKIAQNGGVRSRFSQKLLREFLRKKVFMRYQTCYLQKCLHDVTDTANRDKTNTTYYPCFYTTLVDRFLFSHTKKIQMLECSPLWTSGPVPPVDSLFPYLHKMLHIASDFKHFLEDLGSLL